ncbi:unnamed protein product [Oncorhynchus mykiss]|uniref:Uncharacterized protein n=1 Tax=Oncorhynchus mykiss TaxID=8022 RepID=A0A060XT25_ONCMY|nr:unnamed protein product [Oncorhynchus mykiss]
MKLWVCTTEEGLHKLSETVSGKLICVLIGLNLTAVWCCNRLQWANAYLQWPLDHWRIVLFTDESCFQMYRADGRQRVWHCVGSYVNRNLVKSLKLLHVAFMFLFSVLLIIGPRRQHRMTLHSSRLLLINTQAIRDIGQETGTE